MSLELLKKSLLEAPIVKMGEYQYVIHPITDGTSDIRPELLKEVVNEMHNRIKQCNNVDKIITIESMGIPLATALSIKMKIPFVIIRKRSYNLPNEISIKQQTGYSKSNLYINGLKKGDSIVIVDDIISTGGTLYSVISSLKKMGVNIKGVFVLIDKGNATEKLKYKLDVKIDTLVNIDIVDGKVEIKNF